MGRRGRLFEAVQWLMIWAAFSALMCVVTDVTGIYTGWWRTALTAAPIVALWYLFPRLRARRARQTAARQPDGGPQAP